ncbi:BREX-1 system phosphatase PglZ type A [Lacticaseibacillus saniviri]
MAELNLTQMISTIESLFTSSNLFVFWYDEQAEFEQNISEIAGTLKERVVIMNPSEQFKTKLLLNELQKSGTPALIYSPSGIPTLEVNLLADYLRFSKLFAADALTMLQEELGLTVQDKLLLQQYTTFFASKERKDRFKSLYQANKNFEMTILAAIVKANNSSLTAVLSVVLTEDLSDQNKYLQMFAKYGIDEPFWNFVNIAYGYQSQTPTLKELFTAMLLNVAFDQMNKELPASLNAYALTGANNAIAFIQNARNTVSIRERIKEIANQVWDFIRGEQLFNKIDILQLVDVNAFPQIDQVIISWIIEQIALGDTTVRIGRQKLSEVVQSRQQMEYGSDYVAAYAMLENGLQVLEKDSNTHASNFEEAMTQYTDSDYRIDTAYREFNTALDDLPVNQESLLDGLTQKVETRYLNDFLTNTVQDWNAVYQPERVANNLKQQNFYRQFVAVDGDRTIVIISDAFRFEAAKALEAQLTERDVVDADMQYLLTALPSVTYFGMPSLLPNRELTYVSGNTVLVDGQDVGTTQKRRQVLQGVNPNSTNALVKDFLQMTRDERQEFLSGENVVYLYHNRIDTTGEKSVSEQNVFYETQQTIDELARVIELLRNLSARRIIITADHGFIYRRSSLDSANKIDVTDDSRLGIIKKEQRYIISEAPVDITGVQSVRLGSLLTNDDQRWVSYPNGFDIFTALGPSQNYVHGGSSPQEMIVPVLDVHMRKGKSQAEPALIHDVSQVRRLTSREATVQIMQDKPVGELVTATKYQLFFVDADNQPISGVVDFTADSRLASPSQRTHSMRLTLKDAKYHNGRLYTLVMRNTETKQEIRSDYTMDMVIGGGFGFDI